MEFIWGRNIFSEISEGLHGGFKNAVFSGSSRCYISRNICSKSLKLLHKMSNRQRRHLFSFLYLLEMIVKQRFLLGPKFCDTELR